VRVSVVGSSGSGKSTFGRALAARLDVPFVELDSIFHQPGWTELPEDEFRARVSKIVAADAWVVDGNYSVVRPIVLDRATTVVWLDYPRSLVMSRVIRRSFVRAVTRAELWNGNRERMRTWIEPEHPIRWSWSHHDHNRVAYAARFSGSRYRHLEVYRFRSPRAAETWLDTLRREPRRSS
jgi:adenylate kinase family enzyme